MAQGKQQTEDTRATKLLTQNIIYLRISHMEEVKKNHKENNYELENVSNVRV